MVSQRELSVQGYVLTVTCCSWWVCGAACTTTSHSFSLSTKTFMFWLLDVMQCGMWIIKTAHLNISVAVFHHVNTVRLNFPKRVSGTKRGTRARHDPRTGLHADTGEDKPDHEGSELVYSTSTNCLSTTLELLSSSQSEQARVNNTRESKHYCLIKQSPETVRQGRSTISQEWTSHRLSGPPHQDLQCCTTWQRGGRRLGLTATSTWGSPQGNGNQNEAARRILQRVRQVLSHVWIITMCTLPIIWYPAGTARWQQEELDATKR